VRRVRRIIRPSVPCHTLFFSIGDMYGFPIGL
jgi:hypothetical protein